MEDRVHFDTHHIFWDRHSYSAGWAKRLRDYWYCKTSLPKDSTHRQIHSEIKFVPVPRAASIKSALAQLRTLEKYGAISHHDSAEKRLTVLSALFACIEPKTCAALESQLRIVCEFCNKKAPD